MNKVHKLATYLLIGTLALSGNNSFAQATETGAVNSAAQATDNFAVQTTDNSGVQTSDNTAAQTSNDSELQVSEEPIAGIDLSLDELFQSTDNAAKQITQILPSDSEYDNLAIAQVTNYVNIRSEASENGEILGKLYNDSAATILSEKDGWYKIQSGSVTGYIKAEFLVTGDEAKKLAESIGRRIAEVNTTTLKVREKASTDSAVLTLVAQGDDLQVLKELDGWVKVAVSKDETGYISSDFVKVQTVFEEAESIEEEQARLEEETAADTQSASTTDANARSSSSNNSTTSGSSSSNSSSGSSSSGSSTSTDSSSSNTGSSLGSQIASYAVQFVGNPYVWGGTSLTNGADCSGFTQSVFAHFGISIPRTSRTQATGGTRVSLDNLQPGDLIFYTNNGTINHVALYIGSGRVISASSPSTGIRITNYNYRTPYKAVRYTN